MSNIQDVRRDLETLRIGDWICVTLHNGDRTEQQLQDKSPEHITLKPDKKIKLENIHYLFPIAPGIGTENVMPTRYRPPQVVSSSSASDEFKTVLDRLLASAKAQAWQDGHDTALLHGQSKNPYNQEPR